jgi:Na+-translocating ferredoxin:NAD+ oxidoreductase RnfD subunit
MLKKIDNWLNGIVMYKLVVVGLLAISAVAIVLGFAGQLAWSGWSLLASMLIAVCGCYGVNILAAKIWKAQINDESSVITGLILFLIMGPVTTWAEAGLLFITAAVAMLSKYLLAYRHKHIFNPVAVAAVIMAMTGGYAAWWCWR